MRNKGGMDRKGLELEELGKWIIAVIVLVVILVGFLILKTKGISMIEFIKNLFRFGR